jgi:small-conductance mechanosensitive channel
VKEFEGTVEQIELRATHLRTSDNRLIIIPNADLYIATITNNTASPYRRQEFLVGIDYAADLSRASAMAQRLTQETPGVLADPAPDVLVDELASSTVNLKIRFHTDSRRGNATTVSSQVKQRVKEGFQTAGIAFHPSGTQLVPLQKGDPPSSPASAGSSGTDTREATAPGSHAEPSSPLPAGQPASQSPSAAGEGGAPAGSPSRHSNAP